MPRPLSWCYPQRKRPGQSERTFWSSLEGLTMCRPSHRPPALEGRAAEYGVHQGPALPLGTEKGLKGRQARGLPDTQNSGCLSVCRGPGSVVIIATVYQARSQPLGASGFTPAVTGAIITSPSLLFAVVLFAVTPRANPCTSHHPCPPSPCLGPTQPAGPRSRSLGTPDHPDGPTLEPTL